MVKRVRYTPHPGNTFPRDTDPRPILIENYVYTVSHDGETTVQLAGIKGTFPKYVFTEVPLDVIEISVVDGNHNAVALLRRWLDKEQGRVMGGLFLTLAGDTEACLNEIYSRYGY